jgi:hypothetical protein
VPLVLEPDDHLHISHVRTSRDRSAQAACTRMITHWHRNVPSAATLTAGLIGTMRHREP